MCKKVVLKSSDGETFELPMDVALQCGTIKEMNDDGCADDVIPVPITGTILSKVIEFCRKHAEEGHDDASKKELHLWDCDFAKSIDHETLRLLIMAANHLDIDHLLNLTLQVVSDWIYANTTNEQRRRRYLGVLGKDKGSARQ